VKKITEEPLVSVIIPTFNRANMIEETINSVLSQTYKNIEILVSDDGSTDTTKEILKKYISANVKYFWQENKGRPACPRNLGIKNANGKYIAFLDSDDLWIENKLAIQISILEKNSELIGISSNATFFGRSTGIYLTKSYNRSVNFREVFEKNPIVNSSVVIRKEICEKIGLLDEDPILRGVEDFDYWLRILNYKDNSFYIIDDSLIKYRTHLTNISYNPEQPEILFEELEKIKKIYQKYEDLPFTQGVFAKRQYETYILVKKIQLYEKKIKLKDYLSDKKIPLIDKIKGFIKYSYKKFVHTAG